MIQVLLALCILGFFIAGAIAFYIWVKKRYDYGIFGVFDILMSVVGTIGIGIVTHFITITATAYNQEHVMIFGWFLVITMYGIPLIRDTFKTNIVIATLAAAIRFVISLMIIIVFVCLSRKSGKENR